MGDPNTFSRQFSVLWIIPLLLYDSAAFGIDGLRVVRPVSSRFNLLERCYLVPPV
jgi:hypothetical protein